MKITLDTNILIAAFISRGVCSDLFEYCIRQHEVFTSQYILKEFTTQLNEKFKVSRTEVSEAKKLLRSRMQAVIPLKLPKSLCRDPNDVPILGTALASKSQCLITGDKDLLELEAYEGIAIIPPASFWQFETQHR